jgi:hypothetical protein
MNPTQVMIEIGGQPVELKARREDGGRWSVIAFHPAFSIRSNKIQMRGPRGAFVRAIVRATIVSTFEGAEARQAEREVEDSIFAITSNFAK